jgi:hypothetical protein
MNQELIQGKLLTTGPWSTNGRQVDGQAWERECLIDGSGAHSGSESPCDGNADGRALLSGGRCVSS